MNRATIYTKTACPYCSKAKQHLDKMGIEYNEVEVGQDITTEEFKMRFNGATTVPQIILDENHIGGYDDLVKQTLLVE